MIRFTTLALCALILSVSRTVWADPPDVWPKIPPLTADRTSVAPGQAVTLSLHFTGKKIVASGGRFGKGVDVTSKTSVTDRPKKTTRYTFTVYYVGLGIPSKTGATVKKPLQAR